MPPTSSQPPSSAPGQFDFMMKEQPKSAGLFNSLLASVPRPAKIILVAAFGLILLVILYSLFFGSKTSNADQLTAAAARAQEIARVSTLVQTGSQSSDTQGLAATTSEVLTSQEQQLEAYLKAQKIKVSTKTLSAKLDKTTDDRLTAAQQGNNYDQTYFSYLKTNLITYQSDLALAYKGAGKNAQAILSSADTSVQTLLLAPQLK